MRRLLLRLPAADNIEGLSLRRGSSFELGFILQNSFHLINRGNAAARFAEMVRDPAFNGSKQPIHQGKNNCFSRHQNITKMNAQGNLKGNWNSMFDDLTFCRDHCCPACHLPCFSPSKDNRTVLGSDDSTTNVLVCLVVGPTIRPNADLIDSAQIQQTQNLAVQEVCHQA